MINYKAMLERKAYLNNNLDVLEKGILEVEGMDEPYSESWA